MSFLGALVSVLGALRVFFGSSIVNFRSSLGALVCFGHSGVTFGCLLEALVWISGVGSWCLQGAFWVFRCGFRLTFGRFSGGFGCPVGVCWQLWCKFVQSIQGALVWVSGHVLGAMG